MRGIDKPKTLYVGPLMKKGLQDYMDSTGKTPYILKDREMPPEHTNRVTTILFCNECGSAGPFVTDPGDYAKGHLKEMRKFYEIQMIVSVDNDGNVNMTEDPGTAAQDFSLTDFTLKMEEYGYFMGIEFLTCVMCGGEMPDIQEDDQRASDSVQYSNDIHFRADEPTKWDEKTKEASINRDDLVGECASCWNVEEWTRLLEERLVDYSIEPENWKNCIGGLCFEECTISKDMNIFGITAGEVAERRDVLDEKIGGRSQLDEHFREGNVSRDTATLPLFKDKSDSG